uniref:Uncharacterized protein n=1 Tax=Sphaerodactylus townsendi TaxID=933632 RepID=A0ACB8G1L3_9SAUR
MGAEAAVGTKATPGANGQAAAAGAERPARLCGSERDEMQQAMEKSQNFRIDALLAEEPPRPATSTSPGSSAGSPGSCARTETPSPCAPAALASLQPAAFVPKPGLLNYPHPGLGALPALYPPPLYPMPALAGQHPAFAYAAGFPHVAQPSPEHLKVAAVAGSLPLEHWIRTGIMAPRFPDFHGE